MCRAARYCTGPSRQNRIVRMALGPIVGAMSLAFVAAGAATATAATAADGQNRSAVVMSGDVNDWG